MANRGPDSPVLGEEKDAIVSNWSVSKLISSLKSTFRPNDFAKVEAVLMEREEKLKMEIQTLKQQNDSFSLQSEEERLGMMKVEEELKKCRIGFEEMKNALSKLREENMVLRAREKSAEERCEKLLEDVKRIGEKEHELIEYRGRNVELECAKAKAEAELEIMKKRFDELDKRVLGLESDLSLLKDQKDSSSNGIGVENGHSDNGTVKVDETTKVEEVSVGPSCHSPVKANEHSRNAAKNLLGTGRPPSQNIVEIVEIDSDDDDCAEAENLSEKRSHSAENSHSDQICLENGNATLKRKRSSSIEVVESENCDNDDDNTSNGKLKMEKLQEPVCQPDDCSLKHCSTTTNSSDSNEVNRGCATPREDIMVSTLHEQKTESEQKSQNLMNGFPPLDELVGFLDESSCSSESESDDDGPILFFRGSQLAPETQRENKNLCSPNSDSDGPVNFSRKSRLAPETQKENGN